MTEHQPRPNGEQQSTQAPNSPSTSERRLTSRSRLFAGTAAVAIIGLGLAAFAWLPHPGADHTGTNGTLQPISTGQQVAAATEPNRAPPPRMLQGGAPFSFADLVERVAPEVVTVTVEEKIQPQQMSDDRGIPAPFGNFFHDFGGPQAQAPQHATAMGSGFIIDPNGYIVTNNHVVENASKITVKLKDGRNFTAKLVGTDPATDIALVKIDAGKPLPAVQFANSRNVRVGDWVIAVGDPFGLSNTVTAGIVSSLGRTIGNGGYTDYIQIDAPINRGNSGGPAFDIEGQVIGMNTMIFSPSGGSVGIGFAIPTSTIENVVSQLKAHGHVTRGWLGVEIQNFTPEMAASLGNPNMQGAIVAKVVSDGPAAKAGFKQGDIILSIDDTNITDSRDLTRRVALVPPGQAAHFTILRNGNKMTLTADIAKRPAQPQLASAQPNGPAAAGATLKEMGLGLAAMTPNVRQMYNLPPDTRGVAITAVDPNSDAADKGIQPGDVIVSIGNQPIQDPSEVQQAIDHAKQIGRKSVLALVLTQDGERFVALGFNGKN